MNNCNDNEVETTAERAERMERSELIHESIAPLMPLLSQVIGVPFEEIIVLADQFPHYNTNACLITYPTKEDKKKFDERCDDAMVRVIDIRCDNPYANIWFEKSKRKSRKENGKSSSNHK